ncbi:transport and Golgi organization 2 homolog [Prorops nasuta]|uniref:transport and Golgi organization 2 homolog n=1 Tax=Prorops nasuta TaxID=863751 RepID=UPI0034CD6183
MCILFIYRFPDAGPECYKFIVATNRDENLTRPSKEAHIWDKHSDCLGGMDMEPGKEGGTWLALSTKGKAGITLNLTNEPRNSDLLPKGRGSLITDYITSDESASSYLNNLHKINQSSQLYNPYNLILLDLINTNVYYLCSSIKSVGPLLCKDNILAFGNSDIEHPFKKVEEGKKIFANIIKTASVKHQDSLIESLIQFLKSKESFLPDAELQRRLPTVFKELSSIFVSCPDYGTRTHSILLIDGKNRLTFVEETRMLDLSWKRQDFNTILTNDSFNFVKKIS